MYTSSCEMSEYISQNTQENNMKTERTGQLSKTQEEIMQKDIQSFTLLTLLREFVSDIKNNTTAINNT